MNKRIILSISLMLLVGFVVFVSALSDQDQIETSANVEKGWNLISNGIFAINPSQDSEIQIEDISAIYYYDSQEKKYKLVYPLGSLSHEEEEEIEDVIMKGGVAAWVYSKKSGNLKFITDDVVPLNQRPLYSGWNFVSITPGFIGDNNLKSLDTMKGSCDILSAYYWDSVNNNWVDIPSNEKISDVLYEYDRLLGNGLVIKVSDDCKLGASGNIYNPPTIPGGAGTDDLIIEKDFGTFEFNKELGQEYIEREYTSFPLSKMVRGNAAKYGSPVGVNAIVIEFEGDRDDFVEDAFFSYSTDWERETLSGPAYFNSIKLEDINSDSIILIWHSNNYFVMIHGDNLLVDGSDQEQIAEDYHDKYPSTII